MTGVDDKALPPGQVWGKRFVIYAALGIPRIDSDSWRLKIDGLVDNEKEYTYDGLTSLPQTGHVDPFFCVTRWSIRDVRWEGVPIKVLVDGAGVKPDAKWVMFHCADGYTAPVPLEEAVRDEALLAFRINGKPLSEEQGFPARTFFPRLYGWKSAKWVNRVELISGYQDGYWEKYGYHERGGVWEEERFKGRMGVAVQRRAFGTAP